jgi:hypothetical protein
MSEQIVPRADGPSPNDPMTAADVEQRLQDAIGALQESAESALYAAVELNSVIISDRKTLVSEAAMLRSAAELLHHMAQLFARITAPTTATPDNDENG